MGRGRGAGQAKTCRNVYAFPSGIHSRLVTRRAQRPVRCTDGKHETALLLFDGHSTHLTLQAIQEAEMQGQRSGGRRHQAIVRRRARPRGAFCPGPGPGPCPLSLSRSLPALPVPARFPSPCPCPLSRSLQTAWAREARARTASSAGDHRSKVQERAGPGGPQATATTCSSSSCASSSVHSGRGVPSSTRTHCTACRAHAIRHRARGQGACALPSSRAEQPEQPGRAP